MLFPILRKFVKKIINPETDSNFRELYKGSAIALIVKLAGLLLGYIFSLIIAKLYGSSVLGNFLIGITILNFLVMISTFGMDTAIVAFVSKAKALSDFTGVKKILAGTLKIVIPISLMLYILAYIFINHFRFYFGQLNENAITVTNILLITLVPLAVFKIISNFYRGLKKILTYSVFNYLLTYLFALSIILIAVNIFSFSESLLAIIYAGAIILSFLTGAFILFFEIRKYRGNSRDSNTSFKEIPKYSFPILISDLLKNGRNWMVLLLVGYLMTEKEVGVLGIALKLTFAPSLLINAVNSIAMPKFSEQFSLNDIEKLKRTLAESARVIFWTSFPLLVGIFFFSGLILKFLGKDFQVDMILIFILMVGVFFEVISGSSAYFLQMVGRQKINTLFLLISNIVLLILLLVLIPVYGITGAVVAVTISFIIYSISLVIYAKFVMGFSTYYFPFKTKLKSLLKI